MKKGLIILAWCFLFAAMAVGIFYVSQEQQKVLISELSIEIYYPGKDVFLKKHEIENIIFEMTGDIYNKTVNSVNVRELEAKLIRNPYVRDAHVFIDLNARMFIKIDQRQPIARISSNKDDFYIDDYGVCLPLSEQHTSRVMLISGFIPNYTYEQLKDIKIVNIEKGNDFKDIYYLANFIYQNEFLKALTEQVYVNHNKEFEIVPKIGKQLILVGDTSNLEKKFQKLILFYKYGIKQSGWDKYKSINLKFNNQVVCTKI